MAIDTQNRMEKNDNITLWTIVALIVLAVLAYAAYAAYHNNTNYASQTGQGAVSDTTTTNGTRENTRE